MKSTRATAVAVALVLISALAVPVQAAQGGSTPGVDLALTLTGPTETPKRGTTFSVTLEATNLGSETATDVSISTYLPDTVAFMNSAAANPSMTCNKDQYGTLTCAVAQIEPGATTWVMLTLERLGSRETWIDAWVASSSDDDNWENNSSWLYFEADRSNPADVAVDISSPDQPEVGEQFAYTSAVTNRGPERARSVSFRQSLSELAEFVSVSSSDPTDTCELFEETYDAEGLEGGPYTYREVRCELGDMDFAERTHVTVNVIRKDPHELWSSAWISTTSYDDNYENDWADASTAGHPSVTSDLIMTLTRPDGTFLVGEDFTYTLNVTNAGPAAASDVTLDTWLPEQLALRAVTPARTDDVCQQSEYQGISCTLGNLASGETASIVVDVTRVGAREFWLGGSVWSSNYDPLYDNNYVEDQMDADRSTPADIAVSMTGPKDPAVGSNFDYTVQVTNTGPEEATSVSMNASIPEGTEFVAVTSPDESDVCSLFEETYEGEGEKMADGSISAYTYREVRCSLGTLVPAETATVTVTLNRTNDYQMWASAWASTASFDENYENDYASFGSDGEPAPGCGKVADSEGGIVLCDTAGRTGEGGGDSYAVTSEPGKRVLRAGSGDDTITLRIPTHSKKHRRIVVDGGRGKDVIKVLLAPGAGNVTLILKGGPGRDSIEVFAPRPGKRFTLRMWGGRGNDTCSSVRGDRHRSRAC